MDGELQHRFADYTLNAVVRLYAERLRPPVGAHRYSARTTTVVKADLNLALVKRLNLSEKPIDLSGKGARLCEANVGNKPYILWDSNRDAPSGFGVCVAGKKTYIIRRKVDGVSIMLKVGSVSNFLDVGLARKKRRVREAVAPKHVYVIAMPQYGSRRP